MLQSSEKLTVYEWEGLSSTYNLADGHPRQTLLPVQRAVLADMAGMFAQAHHAHEPTAKQQFEQAFFELAEQHSVLRLPPPLAQYSGSVAIELIVNYLRLQHMRVAFLHPSFDSLADTMRRHKVPLIPLEESMLHTLTETSPKLPVDAIYIVCPNNPTGKELAKAQFEHLVAYCKKHHLLLIVDFCFRFYSNLWQFDQYKIMQDAGIDFVTTEDTGKTWPAADVKLGMVLCSRSLHADLKAISDDFLLSVSPFVFELLSKYISVEKPEGHRILSRDVADANRKTLQRLLEHSPVRPNPEPTSMSVEWLRLPDSWTANDFGHGLAHYGMQVLPGEPFYWNNDPRGKQFIRVALLRDNAYFKSAITLLKQVAERYQP